MRCLLTCLGTLSLLALPAVADETPPDYTTQVAPILKKYCAGCHNDTDREGDFSLETYAALQKGTPKAPAFLPGDAESSRLVRLVTGAAEPRMPPEDEPRPTDAEVELLKAWITAGGKGPAGAEPSRLALIVPRLESRAAKRPVTALDTSRDGRWLALARYGQVALHALQDDGSTVAAAPTLSLTDLPGKVTSLHFTPDGSQLIVATGVAGLGGVAEIRNLPDGTLARRFEAHRDILYDAELSPDGGTLATCGYDKQIRLWDARTGEQLRLLEGHNGAVYDVAFSPDGKYLVSASADDTCKVWRVADGLRLDTLFQPLKEVYCCQFTPDGRHVVAGGADNTLRVWRFVSRDKPRVNPLVLARFAHEGPLVRLAFTQDGSRLVTLAEDRTIKVWDTRDYTELKLWDQQPEVGLALTVADSLGALFVGRADGSWDRYPLPDLAPGARQPVGPPAGEAVVMSAAAELAEVAEREPNQTPGDALRVTLPVRVRGTIQGQADGGPDYDLVRFAARAGEQWVIDVDAARSKSRLDSLIEVLDADGQRIPRLLLQAVRDSYFTFRGKDDVSVDDFRVFNWEDMGLNEYLYANGEIVKLWLHPRGPDSGFMVYPGQGKRWGYFDTTPLAHALGEPCYVVEPHPPGTQLIPNGLPVFPLYYENDDDSRRELGKDSRLTFTVPSDGEYLVKIKDVRDFEGADFTYQLAIRPRRPDFQVTLHGANPTVAPGTSREFRVTARRLDDFEGPIQVAIDGLPAGFSVSSPVVIEPGQIEALGVITAAADAAPPAPEVAKASRVVASAVIGDQEVARTINNLGEIKLGGKPKLQVAVLPAEGGAAPLQSATEGPLEFAVRPGETIMLKVRVQRDGFDGPVPFGKEGAGRNLPFGVYVDNLGLNGLLVLGQQEERTFFITADRTAQPQSRLFHLNTSAEGGVASAPVLLHIRP
ncbi:MAG: hypothetical protein J5I93_29035 [Pirellulaceae bacterium]|nr:hypothetical protein [Pirellulaceae bacterium]